MSHFKHLSTTELLSCQGPFLVKCWVITFTFSRKVKSNEAGMELYVELLLFCWRGEQVDPPSPVKGGRRCCQGAPTLGQTID